MITRDLGNSPRRLNHRTNRLRLEFRAELLPGHSIPSISPTDSTRGGPWSGNNPSPHYDKPRTPFDRLLDADVLSPAQIAGITAYRDSLNPAQIARDIQSLQDRLTGLASIFHDGPVWGWSAPVASRLF